MSAVAETGRSSCPGSEVSCTLKLDIHDSSSTLQPTVPYVARPTATFEDSVQELLFRVVRHLPGSEAMSRTAATVGQVLDKPRWRKPRRVPPWLENALNLWGFGRWSRGPGVE